MLDRRTRFDQCIDRLDERCDVVGVVPKIAQVVSRDDRLLEVELNIGDTRPELLFPDARASDVRQGVGKDWVHLGQEQVQD